MAQEELEAENTKNPQYKFLFWETILTILIFALGISTARNFHLFLQQEKIVLPQISAINFIGYLMAGTIAVLLAVFLIRKKRTRKGFFKFLFVIGNIYGALSVLPGMLNMIFPAYYSNVLAIAITALTFWAWFVKPTLLNHNFLMVVGLAGVGGMVGLQMSPVIVVIILAILAAYDFIAVYKTRHMVKMAESMIESETIIGLIIPSSEKQFMESVPNSETRRKFVILGGGDLAIPLMLAVSFIPQGMIKVLIVAAFSLLGIILSFLIFYSQKSKEAIPALPAIVFVSLIGCLIAILV